MMQSAVSETIAKVPHQDATNLYEVFAWFDRYSLFFDPVQEGLSRFEFRDKFEWIVAFVGCRSWLLYDCFQ